MNQRTSLPQPKQRGKFKKILGGFFSVVFSICAFGGFLFQMNGATVKRDLPVEIARARKNGLWVTAADIQASPRKGADGTAIIEKYEKTLGKQTKSISALTKSVREADANKGKELLAPHQEALKDAKRLSEADFASFLPRAGESMEQVSDRIFAFRALLFLTGAEADWHINSGNAEAALSSMRQMDRMLRLVTADDSPIVALNHHAGRTTLGNIQIRGFRKWISNPTIREKFAQPFPAYPPVEMSRILASDALNSLSEIRKDSARVLPDSINEEIPVRSRHKAEMLALLRIMNDIAELPEFKSGDWKNFVAKAEKRAARDRMDLFGGGGRAYNYSPLFTFYPNMAYPDQIEILTSETIRLHRVKALTGQFPETLSKDAKDLYSGESLKYIRQGDGFVLYSVGADFNDDGGKTRDDLFGKGAPSETNPEERGDIVRRFPESI